MALPDQPPCKIRGEIEAMARLIGTLGRQQLDNFGSLYRPRRQLGCLPQVHSTWGTTPLIVKHVDPPLMVLVLEDGSFTTRLHLPIAILRMHPKLERVSDALDQRCPTMLAWFRTQSQLAWRAWMFSRYYVWAVIEQTGHVENCDDYVGTEVVFRPEIQPVAVEEPVERAILRQPALASTVHPAEEPAHMLQVIKKAKAVKPTIIKCIAKRRSPKRSAASLSRFMASR